MILEIESGETGSDGARRILLERISCALRALDGRAPLADKAVHDARKELKRARATLKLIRDGIGERAYRRDNDALRSAARPLTHVRDAKVMLDTIERLAGLCAQAAGGPRVEPLRRILKTERTAIRREVLQSPRTLAGIRRTLRASSGRVKKLPARRDGWAVYGAGLQRTCRRGRRAFAAARAECSPDLLHEWRKQVKFLWHQLQILQPLRPGVIGELADQLHKLAEYLGEDHDLWVLRQRAGQHPDAFARPGALSAFVALIDGRRAELQDRAMALGERLYGEKPRSFQRRMCACWQAWRRQAAAA